MKSLYLRIYATVVAVLLLFALAAGWVAQRNIESERESFQAAAGERVAAWADLIENSLPPADASEAEQRDALLSWSARLRMPLALDAADGRRIATSQSYERSEAEGRSRRAVQVPLSDGRTLWLRRPGPFRVHARPHAGGPPQSAEEARAPAARAPLRLRPAPWLVGSGLGLGVVLLVLFLAVAVGAWPVVRRLTRRLEALQRGVEQFGAGHLQHRVDASGSDEVAAVAASFNRAAERIEALVQSHQSLLANASHELRSPLARLKLAVAMLEDAPAGQRERLRAEIDTNIAELDALVDEVLLTSRLDAQAALERHEPLDLLALAAEEGARTGAFAQGAPLMLIGDERLLRRALRNLLENARRYGGGDVTVMVERVDATAEVRVCDRGPGVPEAMRERIFEPFFRMPGHAEREGGVGLGLALVKQIAQRHGGSVRCDARDGGGSCFVLRLPLTPPPPGSSFQGGDSPTH